MRPPAWCGGETPLRCVLAYVLRLPVKGPSDVLSAPASLSCWEVERRRLLSDRAEGASSVAGDSTTAVSVLRRSCVRRESAEERAGSGCGCVVIGCGCAGTTAPARRCCAEARRACCPAELRPRPPLRRLHLRLCRRQRRERLRCLCCGTNCTRFEMSRPRPREACVPSCWRSGRGRGRGRGFVVLVTPRLRRLASCPAAAAASAAAASARPRCMGCGWQRAVPG